MKKIIKNYFTKKGLSLVEVVISVALITLIMLSSMAYFNAAWDVRAKAEEYNEVLYNVVANLESAKYNINAGVTNFFPTTDNRNVTSRGTNITYSISKSGNKLTSSAVYRGNKIILVSHACTNW